MIVHRRRAHRPVALLAALLSIALSAAPVSAATLIGRSRVSGTKGCAAGQTVLLDSYAVGHIQHGWTTEGGPNPYYYTNEFDHAPKTDWDATYTRKRAITWFMRATPSYGGYPEYGILDWFVECVVIRSSPDRFSATPA